MGLDSQTLFDALAGSAGHPVDRPSMDANVLNSQYHNGLVSAQTDAAMATAGRAQRENAALDQLEESFTKMYNGDRDKGRAAASMAISAHGNAENAVQAMGGLQKQKLTDTVSDPKLLGQAVQTAAFQGLNGKPNDLRQVPENYAVNAGEPDPIVHESPLGAAHAANLEGSANLHNVQAAVGGFNPNAAGSGLHLTEGQAALVSQAVAEGRLDPSKINIRNSTIISSMLEHTPGINLNRLSADANLQRNATFQQRAMSMEALPTVISNVAEAGKKLDFSNNRWVGDAQGWLNGVNNDPDMTAYMTQRNDALMTIAAQMRGVGMSDKAHQAEIEAMHPTLSQPALDAWFHAQLKAIEPRLQQQRRVTHLGGAPSATAVSPSNPAGPPVAVAPGTPGATDPADPLGIRGK